MSHKMKHIFENSDFSKFPKPYRTESAGPEGRAFIKTCAHQPRPRTQDTEPSALQPKALDPPIQNPETRTQNPKFRIQTPDCG